MKEQSNRRYIETILVVFLLLALLVALYDVLHIFFGVLTFALVFATSFNGFFEWLVRMLKNKRKVATFVYAILLIALMALPLGFLFSSLARNAEPVVEWINNVKENGLPEIPTAIAGLPLVGKGIVKLWDTYHDDPKQIINDHREEVQKLSQEAMQGGVSVLGTVVDVIIGIIISAVLLFNKQNTYNAVKVPLDHLMGRQSGSSLLDAIAMSMRGVFIGVMGSAFIAAVLAFIGFEIAGVPFAVAFAAIVFFLVVIQLGPIPLWIPLCIWMSTQESAGKVLFLVIWGVALVIIEAIIKPIIIGKSGGKLPFLVLFLGVIGGLAAWGFTGMFKGAIILAVFYTVYNSWLASRNLVR